VQPNLVSVVLPVYNGERYIEAAIRSLLAQTVACEIVVSDDCSTDNTREIVRSINAPQLVLLENGKRGGQFANFNRTLRAATGQLIQMFSHDDIAHPGFVASQIASFEKSLSIGLVYASCNVIDAHGVQCGVHDDHGTPGVIDFPTYLAISSRHGSISPSISCVMIRRQVLDTVGMFDERLDVAADLDLYNRVAERFLIARNRAMLLDIRVHPESVTSGRLAPLRHMGDELKILPFYRRHLGEAGYAQMMRHRARARGATHAKYIIRAFLSGRLNEGHAAYKALSAMHNVPVCIYHALVQAARDRIARLLPTRPAS
jgi:glycosyltransferase involved in cell wall biosynthesis